MRPARRFIGGGYYAAFLVASVGEAADVERIDAKLEIPQSIKVDYDQLLAHLTQAIDRHGNAGHLAAAPQTARRLIKAHFDDSSRFVFPPLGLLPAPAEGKVTREMAPAVP